jgi:hypothetical protein
MQNHTACENLRNIEVIKQAYAILQSDYAFHRGTVRTQMSFFDDVYDEDYKNLDYKLKAIRQDLAKILVMMNSIERTYSAYQKDECLPQYFSIMGNQALDELGCFIEYLFAKYRVILEYVQQVLEICVPLRFTDEETQQYNKIQKAHKKFKFLLNYIATNRTSKLNLLNMEWFQQLRVERDFIIHDGATCLVFGNKERLLFKIMTVDALDKDDKSLDEFYTNNENLIDYQYYWALHISKLIIFVEAVFGFVLDKAKISEEAEYVLSQSFPQGRTKLATTNGEEFADKQDVLVDMLKTIIK